MEIIRELEEEFAAKRLANGLGRIALRTPGRLYNLDEARLASDFILGRSGNRIYFFPNQSLTEVSGIEVQSSMQEQLASILGDQRQPVKLLLANGSEIQSAWLLNVEGQWLRVAGQDGVLWIPIARLLVAETDLLLSEPRN
jgi:hypothetical protein